MPARLSRIDRAWKAAPWIERIEDPCLREGVLQALIARDAAIRARGDDRVIGVGDHILESVRLGRVVGTAACRKASDAIRKYDEAYMRAYRASQRVKRSRSHTGGQA